MEHRCERPARADQSRPPRRRPRPGASRNVSRWGASELPGRQHHQRSPVGPSAGSCAVDISPRANRTLSRSTDMTTPVRRTPALPFVWLQARRTDQPSRPRRGAGTDQPLTSKRARSFCSTGRRKKTTIGTVIVTRMFVRPPECLEASRRPGTATPSSSERRRSRSSVRDGALGRSADRAPRAVPELDHPSLPSGSEAG